MIGEGCINFIEASLGRIGRTVGLRVAAGKWNAVANALHAHCRSDSEILLRRNIPQIEKKNCQDCKHKQQNNFPHN
jgi:hypothetical protein